MPVVRGSPVGALACSVKTPPPPYKKQMAMKMTRATALMPLSHSCDFPAMTTPN